MVLAPVLFLCSIAHGQTVNTSVATVDASVAADPQQQLQESRPTHQPAPTASSWGPQRAGATLSGTQTFKLDPRLQAVDASAEVDMHYDQSQVTVTPAAEPSMASSWGPQSYPGRASVQGYALGCQDMGLGDSNSAVVEQRTSHSASLGNLTALKQASGAGPGATTDGDSQGLNIQQSGLAAAKPQSIGTASSYSQYTTATAIASSSNTAYGSDCGTTPFASNARYQPVIPVPGQQLYQRMLISGANGLPPLMGSSGFSPLQEKTTSTNGIGLKDRSGSRGLAKSWSSADSEGSNSSPFETLSSFGSARRTETLKEREHSKSRRYSAENHDEPRSRAPWGTKTSNKNATTSHRSTSADSWRHPHDGTSETHRTYDDLRNVVSPTGTF